MKPTRSIPITNKQTAGPDLWSTMGGIAPGISDSALLEALMYLPDDVLIKIQGFMDLDTEDQEDADFIELYGGLFTLARASTVIEEHGLLHDVDSKVGTSVSSSTTDEAYVSDGAEAVPPVPVAVELEEPPSQVPITESRSRISSSTQGSQTNIETKDGAVQTSPIPVQVDRDVQVQEPPEKRRRITIEVWTENGQIKAAIPSDSLPAGPEIAAERRDSEPATDCGQGGLGSDPMDSENIPGELNSTPEVAAATGVDSFPTPVLRSPQQIEPHERLKLLAGHLHDVEVPHMTEIPSRFGSSPDFGPRCSQCGHKQDASKRLGIHPVDACPVVGRYGSTAFSPATGRWISPPCLYPVCPRNAHHFTKLCPELQSLCLRCGRRGHSTSRCDIVTLEYSKEALKDMYTVFKPFGLRSRKSSKCKDWEHQPTLPAFRVVTHQNNNYLFPWTEDHLSKVLQLDDEAVKAEILQELFK